MKYKIYKNSRALKNTNCFECREKMETVLTGDVCLILNAYPYYFHSKCARKILSAHVVDALDRDQWVERKASERRKADRLADALGYRKEGE